jgi:hypothetical protein
MFSLFYFIPLGAMDNGVWLSPSGGGAGGGRKTYTSPFKGGQWCLDVPLRRGYGGGFIIYFVSLKFKTSKSCPN